MQGIGLPAPADPAGLIGHVEGRPRFPQNRTGAVSTVQGSSVIPVPPPNSASSGPGQMETTPENGAFRGAARQVTE